MYFVISCVLFGIFITLQSSSGESLEISEVSGCLDNRRISKRIYYEAPKYNIANCSGILTQAPGQIVLNIDHSNHTDDQCNWKIQAPEGHSVYLSFYCTYENILPAKLFGDPSSNKWGDLQVYEGHAALSENNLYNSTRNEDLDRCISNGQTMTVIVNFRKCGLHFLKKIRIVYGFIKQSEISDLIS